MSRFGTHLRYAVRRTSSDCQREWSPCRHLRLTSRESGVDGQSGLRRLRGSGTGPAGRRDRDTSPARSRRISRYDREQPSDAD